MGFSACGPPTRGSTAAPSGGVHHRGQRLGQLCPTPRRRHPALRAHGRCPRRWRSQRAQASVRRAASPRSPAPRRATASRSAATPRGATTDPMIATETANVWGRRASSAIPVPTGATQAELAGISCPSAGACVVVGVASTTKKTIFSFGRPAGHRGLAALRDAAEPHKPEGGDAHRPRPLRHLVCECELVRRRGRPDRQAPTKPHSPRPTTADPGRPGSSRRSARSRSSNGRLRLPSFLHGRRAPSLPRRRAASRHSRVSLTAGSGRREVVAAWRFPAPNTNGGFLLRRVMRVDHALRRRRRAPRHERRLRGRLHLVAGVWSAPGLVVSRRFTGGRARRSSRCRPCPTTSKDCEAIGTADTTGRRRPPVLDGFLQAHQPRERPRGPVLDRGHRATRRLPTFGWHGPDDLRRLADHLVRP